MNLIQDLCSRFLSEYKKINSESEPDFYSWYEQQPVNLLNESCLEFQDYILKYQDDFMACENMMEKILNDIRSYSSFHRKAKSWVESHEIMNTEQNKVISPRLRAPQKEDIKMPDFDLYQLSFL